jgi:MFS family permease
MTSGASTPPAALPENPPVKTWRTGTLIYTTTGLVVLFCWLLWGDFAWSMKERSMGGVVQLLLKKFHSSDTLASLLVGSVPALMSMIIIPIVSYKSDRHRGRWGRRMPYLLVPIPFAVAGMACLAFSPPLGATLHHSLGPFSPGFDASVLFCFGLSWIVFELATIVASAVYNALINDVVPREVLGRFYGMFRALSLIAGMVFNHWLFAKAETYYVWIFLGLAALYGVGFSLMCFNVKEGEYPTPVPMDRGRDTTGFVHAAKTYFQECFGHSYYLLYFLAMGISWQAFMPINLFGIFYMKALQMNPQVYGDCITLTYFFSLVLAYPLGALVDRFHPLRVSIVVQILYAVTTLLGGLFIQGPTTYAIALIAHGVLSGTWFTTIASVSQRLLPKAEFAQFASGESIFRSFFAFLVGPAVGIFLDHFNHNYRDTYLISFAVNLAGLICCLLLYRRFRALGGPDNYVAPEFVRKERPVQQRA